ncbi:hypothetical protein MC885_003408 [Smutsia gigantea]|nr:hypothetical protein MC885_003408 [Smutsia gigantea]
MEGQQADISMPTCAPMSEKIGALMLAQIVSFPSERLRVASRQPSLGSQVLRGPLFLSRAAGRSLLAVQSCSSSREVVSYSPGPSGVKFRSHPDHLTVDAARRLAGGHRRSPGRAALLRTPLQRRELATRERRRRAGAHPGTRGSKCLAAASRFSLRLPHRPSTADLHAKLGRAASLAASPSARGPTLSRVQPAARRQARVVNGKMEMDVEGISPRSEPIPRSQGAGGACPAPPPPPPPQPQPQPRPRPRPPPPPQQLARDDLPGESAGTEDSDDPEATPHSEKGESKVGPQCRSCDTF